MTVSPVFLLFNGNCNFLTDTLFFYRNIAILLEEVNTNVVKQHISQNNLKKHAFTVNSIEMN